MALWPPVDWTASESLNQNCDLIPYCNLKRSSERHPHAPILCMESDSQSLSYAHPRDYVTCTFCWPSQAGRNVVCQCWLERFVYAVWRAPERANATDQCWGETDSPRLQTGRTLSIDAPVDKLQSRGEERLGRPVKLWAVHLGWPDSITERLLLVIASNLQPHGGRQRDLSSAARKGQETRELSCK